MTDVIEMIDPVTGEIIDEQQLADQLLKHAKEQGVDLVGPDGLLKGLTRRELVLRRSRQRCLNTSAMRSTRFPRMRTHATGRDRRRC